MKMIIGGAYQGKLDFVIKKYGLSKDEIINGEDFDIFKNSDIKCINSYHTVVKRLLENQKNPVEFTYEIIEKNPDIIIIMNEIGSGIIPVEKSERIWREQTGKAGCVLAEKAETVERIVCGISHKIKG